MKKILRLFCLLPLLLGLFYLLVETFGVSAYDFEVDGIYYNVLSREDMTCGVTYKTVRDKNFISPYSGDIVIPSKVTYQNKIYSVTKIGWNAFDYCTGLTSVVIPSSVTEIGDEAFYFCTGLTSVVIPGSVTEFGYHAFARCPRMTEIISLNTIPQPVYSNTFENVKKSVCVVKVPAEAVEAYKNAEGWKEFTNIVAL